MGCPKEVEGGSYKYLILQQLAPPSLCCYESLPPVSEAVGDVLFSR